MLITNTAIWLHHFYRNSPHISRHILAQLLQASSLYAPLLWYWWLCIMTAVASPSFPGFIGVPWLQEGDSRLNWDCWAQIRLAWVALLTFSWLTSFYFCSKYLSSCLDYISNIVALFPGLFEMRQRLKLRTLSDFISVIVTWKLSATDWCSSFIDTFCHAIQRREFAWCLFALLSSSFFLAIQFIWCSSF